ncbi:hypothetical protein WUBG_09524, partial [Wuchereria bancrofti]
EDAYSFIDEASDKDGTGHSSDEMQNTQKANGITKTGHTDIYGRQESVEIEETELVEESTVGQVIVGDDQEYYLILNLNGPDVGANSVSDIGKVDNVQILRNDDGTETVLLEIDELNESELSSDHYRKRSFQNDYHGVEVVDIDKHGKIMQQLFGSTTGSDPYQLGRYRSWIRKYRQFVEIVCTALIHVRNAIKLSSIPL